MNPDQILKHHSHRNTVPKDTWIAYQSWRNVIFLHWPVAQECILPYLPQHPEIKPDLFNGTAWVSLVGFKVANARLRYLPPFPGVSFFNELNLRTYVTYGKDSGTVFLYIDASNRLSVQLNRLIGLPYHYEHVAVTEHSLVYSGSRPEKQDHIAINWSITENLDKKDSLDLWLTERYTSYQQNGNNVYRYPIHHPEWTLQHAYLDIAHTSYHWNSLVLAGADIAVAHYSPGVDALFWTRQML